MGGQAYPSVLDPGARTAIAYGVYGVPETYFIGRDGLVAHKHTGPVTEVVLEEWIAPLRLEKKGPSNDAASERNR
jgi:cytochrome c biogenesis protein CcmG/thiol:disulfide interchange protein DsbE